MGRQEHIGTPSRNLLRPGEWPHERVLPGVLCKRRGILYFAGELARIIVADALTDGNARVSIWLRRRIFYGLTDLPGPRPHPTYSLSCIRASLRSSAIPLWPCFSDWEIPFS
jgi:hypothetical protein